MGEPLSVEFVHQGVGGRCACCGELWPCRAFLRARILTLERQHAAVCKDITYKPRPFHQPLRTDLHQVIFVNDIVIINIRFDRINKLKSKPVSSIHLRRSIL